MSNAELILNECDFSMNTIIDYKGLTEVKSITDYKLT